jgi:predicted GIY-YIG superfamily endonuclease
MYYVYKIENTKTGDVYIGSSSNPFSRWTHHFSWLKHNRHTTKFQEAYNNSNLTEWIFSILDTSETRKEIFKKEALYYEQLNPTLNSKPIIDTTRKREKMNLAIVERLKEGLSYREISKELNVSLGKITYVNREYGITNYNKN